MASEKELEEIRAKMRQVPSQKLRDQRQHLHERKLMDGLIVPGRREQLDILVSLINEELKRRKGEEKKT
jgi:hypothetical protein